MNSELERAEWYLEAAIRSLAAGRTDVAGVHLHHAAVILEVTVATLASKHSERFRSEDANETAIAATSFQLCDLAD